jgi:hypothetical protein
VAVGYNPFAAAPEDMKPWEVHKGQVGSLKVEDSLKVEHHNLSAEVHKG